MKSIISILNKLIKVSNKLDLCGLHKNADIIDGVITKVYNDIGDFSNLDNTDISVDEAFEAGHAVAKHKGKRKHSYMAKPQLAKIHEMSSKLFFMMDDNEQVEDWQETKIAEMAASIEDVYNSMRYHKHDYGIQKYND